MANPLIAIVGSVVKTRPDYEPPLRNIEQAPQACREFGQALAQAGYRLIAYSGSPEYIEADIVSGYIESGTAQPESIQVRFPHGMSTPRFKEQDTHEALFDPRPDTHPDWQVSFYSSLKDADGILVLGGGPSALVAGIIAQAFEKPLVAVSTFGGSAETVWRLLQGGQLASESERRVMGATTWKSAAAATLINSLDAQLGRLRDEQARRRQLELQEKRAITEQAWTMSGFLLGSLVLVAMGLFLPASEPLLFGAIFLATPLLAGASGSLARGLLEAYSKRTRAERRATMLSIVLGMSAGLIAALLFVVAQWASNPEIKDLAQKIPQGLQLLVPFELIIGFVAGLTLETVFAKLQQTDVVHVESVAAKLRG